MRRKQEAGPGRSSSGPAALCHDIHPSSWQAGVIGRWPSRPPQRSKCNASLSFASPPETSPFGLEKDHPFGGCADLLLRCRLRSLRGKRTLRERARRLPAPLLDQGPPPDQCNLPPGRIAPLLLRPTFREDLLNDTHARNLTGILLILTPIAFNIFFTLLSVTFEYPDILREPTGYVLRHFDAGGSELVAIWYGFMLTAVLFVPLAVLVHKALARQDTPYMAVATTFGVVAGVVQFLGLVRWPFLVPYLADTYLDPASSGATRESVAVVFQAFNQYAGVGVGENLGYLFTGAWTALVALAMFGSALPLKRWLALLGMASAAGVLVGMLEPAGFESAADIVVVGYILWSVWLALFGVLLLLPGSIGHRKPWGNPAGKAITGV